MFCPLRKKANKKGVYSLYNAVLVSTIQQSDSAVHRHMSPLFWISFPCRSPQSTEFPVLTVGFHVYFIQTTARELGRGQVWPQRRDTFHCILHGFLPGSISPDWTRDP